MVRELNASAADISIRFIVFQPYTVEISRHKDPWTRFPSEIRNATFTNSPVNCSSWNK